MLSELTLSTILLSADLIYRAIKIQPVELLQFIDSLITNLMSSSNYFFMLFLKFRFPWIFYYADGESANFILLRKIYFYYSQRSF